MSSYMLRANAFSSRRGLQADHIRLPPLPSVTPPLIFLSFHVRLTKNIYFILSHAQNKKDGEFPSEIKGIHHSVSGSLHWAVFVTLLSLREGKERE